MNRRRSHRSSPHRPAGSREFSPRLHRAVPRERHGHRFRQMIARITSGPQAITIVCAGSNCACGSSAVTKPTCPLQLASPASSVTERSMSGLRCHSSSSITNSRSRGSGAGEHQQPPERAALAQHRVDHRAQRRQTDAAGHEHDGAAARALHRPADAERAAHAEKLARHQPPDRFGHRADAAHGVEQPIAGVAAEADRRFADAERIEHVELARRARPDRQIGRALQHQRHRIRGLPLGLQDAQRHRREPGGQAAHAVAPYRSIACIRAADMRCTRIGTKRCISA